MGELRHVLGDAVTVVARGLRLVLAHAPVLMVIHLLGAAGRQGFLWLAVEVSEKHPTLAGLILPLAPMSTLVAFVLMLVVVARSSAVLSVPTQQEQDAQVESRSSSGPSSTRPLAILASALIPFLTVYAAQGYLKEDVNAFVNAATYDALEKSRTAAAYGESVDVAARITVADGWLLVALVALALVLRFLFDHFQLPQRFRPVAFVAAYVEVLWIVVLGIAFTNYQDRMWEWVQGRVFVHWVQDRWADLLDLLGPVGEPVAAVVRALGAFIDQADDVVLVPVAWLTVAAVVLGGSVDVPARRRRPPSPRLARVRARTPHVVRRWTGEVVTDFTSRFSGLRRGLRVLFLGGVVPMATFCLVFILARQAGVGVLELWRIVLGPMDRDTGVAFSPWLRVSSEMVEYVLLAGLLAAAIQQIQVRRERLAAAEAADTTEVDPETARA